MDFKIVNTTTFRVGIDYHRRSFVVKQHRDGTLNIHHVTGAVLYEHLHPAEVSIDGTPIPYAVVDGRIILNLAPLQDVLYSRACICDHSGGEDPQESKIFDLSFDPSFE